MSPSTPPPWITNITSLSHLRNAALTPLPRFQNIVQPPYRTFSQIVNSPLFGARYLHIAPPNSSEDVARLQDEMARYAEAVERSTGLANGEAVSAIWKPKIVFEPTPPSCHSGQREWLEQVCSGLHVLS